MCDASNTFKPEQTRTDKGSMIERYSKREKHEYEPSDPRPTSRKGFVLSQKQDIYIFVLFYFIIIFFFFLRSKMQELTPFAN